MKIQQITEVDKWNEAAQSLGAHPLQLWGWGEVKTTHGWRAERYLVIDDNQPIGGTQVLYKVLPTPFGEFAYIPRGPFGSEAAKHYLFEHLPKLLKQRHNLLALSVEQGNESAPDAKGWKRTPNTILMNDTLVLDLSKSDDDLLADMKKKTRQYIRKSASACEIRETSSKDEINTCLEVYKDTARRANFALHDDEYYHTVSEKLGGASVIYGAYAGDTLLSFLWLAVSDSTAFELYGGVTADGQEARVNYALKWHAIREMQSRGVKEYDLNGLLEGGVTNFKQGFASHETHYAGTYDYPLSPLYIIWTKALPAAKAIYRKLRAR